MRFFGCVFLGMILISTPLGSAEMPVSEKSEACIECHSMISPGITASWKKSRMSRVTPAQAMKNPKQQRRVSFEKLPEGLANRVVGCAECHTMNPASHKDTFDHNDYQVHTVVTPRDCATCHPVEEGQYAKNIMSQAYANLQENPVYRDLADQTNGVHGFRDMKTTFKKPDALTDADSCLSCHGTVVSVTGTETRDTDEGEMDFPVLSGWPNLGVGRINPDGSKGSCSACHNRHRFSIEMARKPHTCSQCHKGPDVPVYKVYSVSKHGNIYSAMGHSKEWDFDAVPWAVGRDFTAPTCATCHVSLVTSDEGDIIAERTHQMNDRLSWRIFGLIYAHPHPSSPDTTVIRNKMGLPLPTELTGEPASQFLIDKKEQGKRRGAMKKICMGCHSSGWVEGHFDRYENTIQTTNASTLTATEIMLKAWEEGVAKGLAQKDSIFNEALEKMWVNQWLFYSNSTRYASAMGGTDYGVFANGRYFMAKNIQDMHDWLGFKLEAKKQGGK
jgi:hypothetical protein